jgi:Ca2+-binding EF-hand superfamily protein
VRPFFTVLSLILVSAVGIGVADEPKGGRAAPDKAKADKNTSEWDIDEFLKMHDKDKDGKLSRDELPERFRHNFARIDTNKDGKLSRDELLKGAAYLHSRRRPSDVVFHLVEMSDCDDCCAEELQRIYTFLRKLDADKDGKIHADELKSAREALVQGRVDRIIKELDTDKDGKISRAEARGQLKKYFDDLDSNKDGFIDRDELLRGATEHPKEVSPRKSDSPPKKADDRPRDE